MLNSIEINNFKGIKHLKIDKLNKITIIGGKNNCGKTSVLSAIDSFFYSNIDEYIYDLEDYFYNLNTYDCISFHGKYSLHNSNKNHKSVEISKEKYSFTNNEGEERVFYTTDAKYEPKYTYISKPYNPELIYFLSTNQLKEYTKAIKQFSEIFKQKKEHQIIECMQIIEPNIIQVNPIEDNLYIDYSNKEVRLPANLSGEGLLRLFNLAVAIATSRNGIVLIDEFENGLHWSMLAKVWDFIVKASLEFNCQIICTTHSYELLKYANDVIQNFDEDIDFGYIRLSKKDEDMKAYHFDKESIDDALSSDLEVR
ncbi:MAG: hypothetical protein RLZZ210_113 [Pseudomonadota bacterium]|jgi:AAA15 family ATPase/GTPase